MNVNLRSRSVLYVTSETDKFLRSLYELLYLVEGWYFGKGSPPRYEQIARAALIGDLIRQAGAETREVFPSEDGGILVAGYFSDDTMEVFCGPNDRFRFSLERNNEDLDYSEGLSLSSVIEKIRRYSWKKENLYVCSTLNTTAKRKIGTQASHFKTPRVAFPSSAQFVFSS